MNDDPLDWIAAARGQPPPQEEPPPRRRKRPPGPQLPHGAPSSGPTEGDYYTSGWMLGELLSKVIEQMNRSLNFSEGFDNFGREAGAIGLISETAGRTLDRSRAALDRRIYSYRFGGTRTASTETADALLLAADVQIEETDLPTFPSNMRAAREMVAIYHEEKGERISAEESEQLARLLWRFGRGFCADNSDGPLDGLIPWLEKRRRRAT